MNLIPDLSTSIRLLFLLTSYCQGFGFAIFRSRRSRGRNQASLTPSLFFPHSQSLLRHGRGIEPSHRVRDGGVRWNRSSFQYSVHSESFRRALRRCFFINHIKTASRDWNSPRLRPLTHQAPFIRSLSYLFHASYLLKKNHICHFSLFEWISIHTHLLRLKPEVHLFCRHPLRRESATSTTPGH